MAPGMERLQVENPRFNTIEASLYLGLKKKTLEKWRYLGRGPVFIKTGSLVYYRKSDLDRWLDSRTRRSTSDPGKTPDKPGKSRTRFTNPVIRAS